MDINSKIKLKDQNSNSGVINCLEKISNGNFPKANDKNFRLFKTFAAGLMCVLVGICITPALTQKNNRSVLIRHNQPANASEVRETTAQNDAQTTKCRGERAKDGPGENGSSSRPKKSKNGPKSRPEKTKNALKPKLKKAKNGPKSKLSKTKNDLRSKLSKAKNDLNLLLNVGCLFENALHKNQDDPEFNAPPCAKNSFGNPVSNVLNGNFTAEEDGWFYYISHDDSGFVYRVNLASGKTELVMDAACDEIFVLGNKLYAKCTDLCGYLMTYDFSEKQHGRVAAGDRFINVTSEYIISCDSHNIYKTLNDEVCSAKETICSADVSMCVVQNDFVYFVEDGNLYYIDINGENKTLIKEDVQTFAIDNSNIYYISNNKLYSTESDTPLSDISMSAINICDGVVYFSNIDDDEKLYSMNIDGTEVKKICDSRAEKICVTPNKIAIKTGDEQVILDL